MMNLNTIRQGQQITAMDLFVKEKIYQFFMPIRRGLIWEQGPMPRKSQVQDLTDWLNSQLSLILGLYTILGFSSQRPIEIWCPGKTLRICENSKSSDGGRLGWELRMAYLLQLK
jgi:hypothetical protein